MDGPTYLIKHVVTLRSCFAKGSKKESQVQDCYLMGYDACWEGTNVSGNFSAYIISPQNGMFL
jgi:hypothetical protein